jgi:hypothetical protein
MKKSLKTRLTLNRETLRNLTSDQLPGVQGGALEPVTDVCPRPNTNVGCPAPLTQTCPTRCGQWYCYGV